MSNTIILMIEMRMRMIKNEKAFTLAEVLITLGIVGVIAALTLPALIVKCDEMIMVNKVKRSYSEIANAVEMRKAELGTSDYAEQFNPNLSEAEQLDGILKYLHVAERCSRLSNGCGGRNRKILYKNKTNNGSAGIASLMLAGERAILKDGTELRINKRSWSGKCIVTHVKYETDENGNYSNVVNGKPVPVYYDAQQCVEMFIDVNGLRGRNQFGYDVYGFSYSPQKLEQHPGGYGQIYDTIRTGKLNYERYSLNEKFEK